MWRSPLAYELLLFGAFSGSLAVSPVRAETAAPENCHRDDVRFDDISSVRHATVIGEKGSRVYLHQQIPSSGSDSEIGASGSTAYLIPGDKVTIGTVCGALAYIQYHGAKKISVGWVRSAELQIIATAPPARAEVSAPSMDDTILVAALQAQNVLRASSNVYEAVAVMARAIPRLSPQDLPSLGPAARARVAWYAGLLAQTHLHASEGLKLIAELHQLDPQEAQWADLYNAAVAWTEVMNPKSPPLGASLEVGSSSVMMGMIQMPTYLTPKYLVVASWCGTTDTSHGTASLDPIIADPAADPPRELIALSGCWSSAAGITVYDPKDLHFLLYVPIILSDDQNQEYIRSVAVIGDVAVAAIGSRYEQADAITAVTINLQNGVVTARATAARFEQLRVIHDQLVGCGQDVACRHLDRYTLEDLGPGPDIPVPQEYLSDVNVQEMIDKGLGRYVNNTLEFSGTWALVENYGADHGLKVIQAASRTAMPVPGISLDGQLPGALSGDGKQAYLVTVPLLIRVDLESGHAVPVGDGEIQREVAFGAYIADWNDGELEVRDASSGELKCAWPALLGMNRDPLRMMTINDGASLLLIGTPPAPQSLRSSVVINVPKLVALTENCSSSTRKAKRGLESAMAALH